MNLNVSQLRERLAAGVGFTSVEQVNDSIIRSTRKLGDLPFAIYYFDIAQDLPSTQETLTKYQDGIIGSRYFEGSKSLQWSNYLYFITNKERLVNGEYRQAKELIERDRSYARKFVITEEDLDEILKPPIVVPSDATPHASILSVWTDILAKEGLDRAILSDDTLPTRLKLIETTSAEPATVSKVVKRSVDVNAAPFMDSLKLKKFRSYPLRRSFDFGSVNLIFGANGTGKTSLLEAIELFYCGRNKRNRYDTMSYELIAELADGRTENATDDRKAKTFRDRNLAWYGQAEVKTNDVFLSFAQFNFLDTDAAVSLTDSTSRIEEDLSKLLVGPDASKTWRNIQRVDEAVTAKLRDLQLLERQIKDELTALDRRLKEVSGVKQESDSIRARLEEMIHRLGWSVYQGDKQLLASSIVEPLSELESLAQQAASLDWTESPVSINGLTKYCREAKITSEKVEADIARLELLRKNETRISDIRKRGQEALTLAEQLKRFIDAGFPFRMEEFSKQQSAVATYANWLAGYDDNAKSVLSTGKQEAILGKYYDETVLKRSAADALLVSTKSEHENFSKMRDQSLNLALQLREIASRILRTSPKPDECPLCHTPFGPNELVKHINRNVDEHLEALGRTLLTQLHEREREMHEASAAVAASGWLKKFCERASLAADITVHSALVEVEHAKRELAEAHARLETLKAELLALEAQGLSAIRWQDILDQLRELKYSLAVFSRETIDQLLSAISQSLANSSEALESERKKANELQQKLAATLVSAESGVQVLKSALSQLKERHATTESLRGKLLSFSSSLPWPGERPLAALAVEASAVRKVAAELQVAFGREEQAKATYSESIKRKEQLVNQHSKLSQRIKRLSEAQITFKTIRNKHSLTRAMEAALKENHEGIETIFSRIHSPADFRGLGSNLTTLIRKVDGKEAKLSQISTGQRAAFALSIFLAQNAQLKVAPPVVLIDDPIAHVDDLNSLSFLDYLREIVLTGRRQIFFATANDKLATLFERKFDFLGNKGFKRFDLRREA